jgi:hypothetical protein
MHKSKCFSLFLSLNSCLWLLMQAGIKSSCALMVQPKVKPDE